MKRVALVAALVLGIAATGLATSQAGDATLAEQANISAHAPHGHASSYYVCGEMDLKVIYDRDVPAIEFRNQVMPIARVVTSDKEQYSSRLNGQDVVLTILDHAVTLKIGDKTYEGCEKVACVPLLPKE